MSTPFIPETAPFSTEQRAWLNGFLAGIFSGNEQSAAVEEARQAVSILWGSQTGNSEGVAKDLAKALKPAGFDPKVIDLADYEVSSLAQEDLLLLVTSTYGDGEPPDNAAAFYKALHEADAPQLSQLRYSVLSLGDSNYPDFCKCGIDIDLRLQALGATPLVPRVDCDVDFDDAFEAWKSAVIEAAGASASGTGAPPQESADAPLYGKKNPFPAKILRNVNLNTEESSKETRHVEFSLSGSGLSYEPGDALAVVPQNDSDYLAAFLQVVGFQGDETVQDVSLIQLLREKYDITSLTLKGVKAFAELSGSESLSALAADKEAFKSFAWGRQLIDLFAEAPDFAFESPDQLIDMLSPLAPRLYSISSSPAAHPDEVHLTVGAVRYDSHGRSRVGVCSNFLARHSGDETVGVYFHPSKSFKLPSDDDAPIIMVGPGTGIAPFRAFLEERSARGAKGKNWLFFGDQHAASDFLYQDQLTAFLKDGLLSRIDTAFSRDQEEKVYVQDRMREQGSELFSWLEAGAYFYVCGDASRMAKDVDRALRDIVARHGDRSIEAAETYIEDIKKAKRYLRDVY